MFGVLISIFVTLYSLFPLVSRFGQVLPDRQDGLLIVWILNQTEGKLPFELMRIFETNIFYPHEYTLAFSNTLVISAIIGSFAKHVSPIAVSNLATLFAQLLTILFSYLFFKDVTKSKLASSIASVAFGLSSVRFLYVHHLQLFALQWFVLGFWLIYKFFTYKNKKYVYLLAIITGIQVWENILPVYWLFLITSIFSFFNLKLLKDNIKHIVLSVVIFLIISSPIIFAYLKVSSIYHFERSIRDAAHFSMGVDEFFTIFFSFGLIISSIYAIFISKIKINKIFLIILIASFLLALGPVIKFNGNTLRIFGQPIPMPYSLAYFTVPGLNAFRTTSRWIIPFYFTISLILAQAVLQLKLTKNYLSILLISFLILFSSNKLVDYEYINNLEKTPNVYKWLKNQNAEVILELPMYDLGINGAKYETVRMYYSLFHKKNLINGYSGFMPPNQLNLESNVDYADLIIINKNLDKNNYFQKYFSNNNIKYEDEDYKVYKYIH